MLLVLIVGVVCLAVGFAVGRLGRFVQMSQIESRLRAMKVEAEVAQDMGEPLPPEWIADEIEFVLGNELRG